MAVDYLLISATKLEQEQIQNRMDVAETEYYYGRPAYRGIFAGSSILLVEGGVGLVNTASILAMLLTIEKPIVILQFGIGGAYTDSGLNVGDIAIATEECYGDLGVLTPEGWLDIESMGFPIIPVEARTVTDKTSPPFYNRIPLDLEFSIRTQNILETNFKGSCQMVSNGPFVTVQQCSGIKTTGDVLAKRFNGICENMEGVAAAHVSYLNKVPFVEVRGISNQVINRDLARWDVDLGIQVCQDAVEKIIENLNLGYNQ